MAVVDLENPKRMARIAGLLYLGLIVFGVFAQVARESLIVWDEAAETASNIIDSEWLYRLSFLSDLFMIGLFLLLPLAFYVLLKIVNKSVAAIVVILVLVSIPVMLINMLLHYSALLLLDDADYLSVFELDQLHALVMYFLNLYTTGVLIATIFHGLWLLPLGYLVYKSGFFPRILGVLLILACIGFLVESFTLLLLPESFEVIIYPAYVVEIIGEFGFMLWLLIKGVDVEQWNKRSLAAG